MENDLPPSLSVPAPLDVSSLDLPSSASLTGSSLLSSLPELLDVVPPPAVEAIIPAPGGGVADIPAPMAALSPPSATTLPRPISPAPGSAIPPPVASAPPSADSVVKGPIACLPAPLSREIKSRAGSSASKIDVNSRDEKDGEKRKAALPRNITTGGLPLNRSGGLLQKNTAANMSSPNMLPPPILVGGPQVEKSSPSILKRSLSPDIGRRRRNLNVSGPDEGSRRAVTPDPTRTERATSTESREKGGGGWTAVRKPQAQSPKIGGRRGDMMMSSDSSGNLLKASTESAFRTASPSNVGTPGRSLSPGARRREARPVSDMSGMSSWEPQLPTARVPSPIISGADEKEEKDASKGEEAVSSGDQEKERAEKKSSNRASISISIAGVQKENSTKDYESFFSNDPVLDPTDGMIESYCPIGSLASTAALSLALPPPIARDRLRASVAWHVPPNFDAEVEAEIQREIQAKADAAEEKEREKEKEKEQLDENTSEKEENKVEEEDPVRKQRMRMAVINEFLDTEKAYIEDLGVLTNVFLFPIRATSLLPAEDISTIFSNVEDLEPIHKEFLQKLQDQFDTRKTDGTRAEDVSIGDILQRFFHYFKLYSVYAANQDASLACFNECKLKKKEFSKFIDVAQESAKCNGLFLNSFLIKPIQRLCKYPLLLRELLKYTPPDHPDLKLLEEAAEKVSGVVDFVNEAKRIAEEQKRMQVIEEKFGIKDLCRPERRLTREGRVLQNKKGNLKMRYLFLFNDMILYMKPLVQAHGRESYKLKFKMVACASLSKAKIVNIADLPEMNLEHAFEIQLDKLKITLCVGSEAEKKKWLYDVKYAVKEFQKKLAFKMKKEQQDGTGAALDTQNSQNSLEVTGGTGKKGRTQRSVSAKESGSRSPVTKRKAFF